MSLRASLDRIIERIETFGLDTVRETLVKHLEGPLWEMRPSGKNIEGQALYLAVKGRRAVIVLAFTK